ncbi:MAG: hypothetical protein HY978_03475 [Candidatus Liptonbacteria bacterium]|nr:hypothetical protein [Candidatus Liptonbacteria bacterium]
MNPDAHERRSAPESGPLDLVEASEEIAQDLERQTRATPPEEIVDEPGR